MIYISSACVHSPDLKTVVESLSDGGFSNIELSGGLDYRENIKEELISLQKKHRLNFACHNYFPPPVKSFVLNLASLDEGLFQESFEHIEKAINISQALGSNFFGFHAGFYTDIKTGEIGKEIHRKNLYPVAACTKRFCDAFRQLSARHPNIALYIENNVISEANFKAFQGTNPFMLTTSEEYLALREKIDFRLLLDVGHLKVSCHTLGLDFNGELTKLMPFSDYIHLSDNNSVLDQNDGIKKDGDMFKVLRNFDLRSKMITLEIRGDIDKIKQSFYLVEELCNA